MTWCLMLDVDGVVVNGRPEDGRSWATDLERDLGISLERLRTCFFDPHWEAIVTGQADLLAVLEACMPVLAAEQTAQGLLDYWFERDSAVNEAILATCGELRRQGVVIYLATNQDHLRARHLMDSLRLRDHVGGMIYSAEIGARKPQRAFFDAALKTSGTRPDRTLLVDDTKANVEAARAAGWHAIHWQPGARLQLLLDGSGLF